MSLFDYTGFRPVDEHEGRWVNEKKKDEFGAKYQVAGPWRKEGCDAQADRSLAWMIRLALRRDAAGIRHPACQSCGELSSSGNYIEVQHIIPIEELVRRQHAPISAAEYRQNSIYNRVGACGHNLVCLCHRCHLRARGNGGRGGVPTFPSRLERFAP